MHLSVFVICLAMVPLMRPPQAAPPSSPESPPVLKAFDSFQKRVLAAAESMPEDGYAARALTGVKTMAEAVGHGVDTNFGLCAGARGIESPKKGTNHERATMSKTDLVGALRDSFEYCRGFLTDAAAVQARPTDVTFLLTHNAQMLTVMEMQLIARGITVANSEAAPSPPPVKK